MIPAEWIRAAVLLLAACMATAASAAPNASIVMDMRNGKILHAENADRRQHPASLTKMMTLYLTFEAVRDGRLSLDQRVIVSRHASRQPASKLYLRAGQRVTIRSLIRATAIKSANDAAMVLAEAIGGSQRNFAHMMTRKAKALGMNNSAFRNPHGLTQSGHYSSARDMAILGRRLFFDFPQYYNIFKRKSEIAAGKQIRTTNRLLSSYAGADGIKTGYTRAAGYNLVASAHRGNERIIGVVLGASSSGSRNLKMARLLDLGFARAPSHVRVVKPGRAQVLVARAPLPTPKPGTPAIGLAALGEALAPSVEAAEVVVARATVVQPVNRRVSPQAPRRSAVPTPRPGSEAEIVVASVEGIPVPRPRPGTRGGRQVEVARAAKRRVGAAPARAGDWAIQAGSYKTEAHALRELVAMNLDRVPALARAEIGISVGRGRSGSEVYRIRATGLSETSSKSACAALKARGRGCASIAPGSW